MIRRNIFSWSLLLSFVLGCTVGEVTSSVSSSSSTSESSSDESPPPRLLSPVKPPHKHTRYSLGGKHPYEETIERRRSFAFASSSTLSSTVAVVAGAATGGGISLIGTPSTPVTDLVNSTVTWSNVPNPQSNDWVALYCVGESLSNWIEWEYVNVCSSWSTGSGTLSFPLWRTFTCSSFEYRLYRDPSPYTLLATSNSMSWADNDTATTPFHIHIAYGTNPQTSMVVSFTTNTSGTSVPALVEIGTQSGVYNIGNITCNESITYYASEMCQTPATTVSIDNYQFPGYIHHCSIDNLIPNTRYYVRVMQGISVSTETNFLTGPTVDPNTYTRFVAYGDMATSMEPGAIDTSLRILDRLNDPNEPVIHFIAHVGDLGYGRSSTEVWNCWMSFIEPVASRLPYMISIGNHEYDYTNKSGAINDPSGAVNGMWSPSWWNGGTDSNGECGVPTDRRFRMPKNGNKVFWYSYEVGSIHITMLSSEHDPSSSAPMGQFLKQDLMNVDRKKTPWLFIGIHRPLYETEQYQSDYDVAIGLRNIIEPLLIQYNVDVVIAGHYHSFLRTCSVRNGTCTTGAPIHYTTGAAGQSLDNAPLWNSSYVVKYDGSHYGYSIITAVNSSALNLQWYWNQDNSLQDDVWVYKN